MEACRVQIGEGSCSWQREARGFADLCYSLIMKKQQYVQLYNEWVKTRKGLGQLLRLGEGIVVGDRAETLR